MKTETANQHGKVKSQTVKQNELYPNKNTD